MRKRSLSLYKCASWLRAPHMFTGDVAVQANSTHVQTANRNAKCLAVYPCLDALGYHMAAFRH